jgi:hypothetical protein
LRGTGYWTVVYSVFSGWNARPVQCAKKHWVGRSGYSHIDREMERKRTRERCTSTAKACSWSWDLVVVTDLWSIRWAWIGRGLGSRLIIHDDAAGSSFLESIFNLNKSLKGPLITGASIKQITLINMYIAYGIWSTCFHFRTIYICYMLEKMNFLLVSKSKINVFISVRTKIERSPQSFSLQ